MAKLCIDSTHMTSQPLPARMAAEIAALLAAGGVTAVHLVSERGMPRERMPNTGITLAPFIMVPLVGEFGVSIMHEGRLSKRTVSQFEALYFQANTWVACRHQRCRRYIRFTLDRDHTLLAIKERSVARSSSIWTRADLDMHAVPRLLGPVGRQIVERLERVPPDADALWARAGLNLLLGELRELLLTESQGLAAGTRAHRTWADLRYCVEDRSAEPLSRKLVAQRFGLAESYVSRLFQRFGNSTFSAYVQRVRLARAEAVLRTSDVTVAQAARLCGFAGANYFIRAFKRSKGTTPGEFRTRG
jgi:AraC-like DNA-binding protein